MGRVVHLPRQRRDGDRRAEERHRLPDPQAPEVARDPQRSGVDQQGHPTRILRKGPPRWGGFVPFFDQSGNRHLVAVAWNNVSPLAMSWANQPSASRGRTMYTTSTKSRVMSQSYFSPYAVAKVRRTPSSCTASAV